MPLALVLREGSLRLSRWFEKSMNIFVLSGEPSGKIG